MKAVSYKLLLFDIMKLPILEKIKDKFKKLWARFLIYIYYSGRKKIIDVIHPLYYLRKRRDQQAFKEIQKEKQLFDHLQSTIQKSTSTGCSYSDYLSIYNFLERHQPRIILELGSGISSVVFAYYAFSEYIKTGSKPKVISMEENIEYHNQIKQIFPIELMDYVDFRCSTRKEKEYLNILGSYYENTPKLEYDFIFIDGPTDRSVWNNHKFKKTFNADLINILQSTDAEIHAFLDQRIYTYFCLKKLLKNAFIKYHPTTKITHIIASKNNLPEEIRLDCEKSDE